MKKLISIAILMSLFSVVGSAQFVGNASQSSSTQANKSKQNFFIKFGAVMPMSPYNTVPDRSATQYADGFMGASTGFVAEFGMKLNIINSEKKVGFYYCPIVASYMQTPLDWSELGAFFSNKEIYSKPVSILDIAQRYGISVKPFDDIYIAAYYRPGLIIPFKYEVTHEDVANGESFLFTGEMSSDATPLMMSHSAGISLRYKIAEITIERYFAQPTYDVVYKDIDVNPIVNINESQTVKIPMKNLIFSVALNF